MYQSYFVQEGHFCPICLVFCCHLHSKDEIKSQINQRFANFEGISTLQEQSNQVQGVRIINEEFFTNDEKENMLKRNKAYNRLKKYQKVIETRYKYIEKFSHARNDKCGLLCRLGVGKGIGKSAGQSQDTKTNNSLNLKD